MDGTAAIEANREALKRIVAMLIDMAGLGSHDEVRAEGGPRRTLPRLLWRAIILLLRPAESAARRLIIAASLDLAVPAPRPLNVEPRHKPIEPLLRRFGIAVTMAPGAPSTAAGQAEGGMSTAARRAKADGGGVQSHIPAFPLLDPPRRIALYGQRRRTVPPHAAPRIMFPGITEPTRLPPQPTADDRVNADGITRRLAAISAALDDLPGQARRFARWKASRDAQQARDPATPRRISPIRLGRPPGGRLSRYDPNVAHPPNIREVDEILAHAHSMALYALESPNTS